MVTRVELLNKINELLDGIISYKDFGDIVCGYLTDEYEVGYKDFLDSILLEFVDLHDIDKKNIKFNPYIPSQEEIIKFRDLLIKSIREKE